MSRIDLAQAVATGAHSGQVRPFTGEPYIGHPARVVGILAQYVPTAGDSAVCAAWLHDVIEDCGVEIEGVVSSFGWDTAALVIELTKPNEPTTIRATIIKACDLIDNIGSIADVAPRYQARAYMAKKAPQVLRVTEALIPYYPALAEALAQAWWRNWEAANA